MSHWPARQAKVMFLDYDGVLHPDEVYRVRGRLVLRAPGELLMWAPLLEEAMVAFPEVRIVLSTSWARELGFARARGRLPEGLRSRVIGATWHSAMRRTAGSSMGRATWWDLATRYEQIKRYAMRAALSDWVAIDDKPEGWADIDRVKLVQTQSELGLSEPLVLARVVAQLERIYGC